MPVATARTIALESATGHLIDVQTDVSQGMVGTTLVGRADVALSEGRDRCRMAILNSRLEWPTTRRVTVLLSPADLAKRGTHFDLAIAVSVLGACRAVPPAALEGRVFIGELTLDGGLRSVPGVLPMVLAAAAGGIHRVVVPEPQVAEAAMVPDVEVLGLRSLSQVVAELRGEPVPEAPPVAASARTSARRRAADPRRASRSGRRRARRRRPRGRSARRRGGPAVRAGSVGSARRARRAPRCGRAPSACPSRRRAPSASPPTQARAAEDEIARLDGAGRALSRVPPPSGTPGWDSPVRVDRSSSTPPLSRRASAETRSPSSITITSPGTRLGPPPRPERRPSRITETCWGEVPLPAPRPPAPPGRSWTKAKHRVERRRPRRSRSREVAFPLRRRARRRPRGAARGDA